MNSATSPARTPRTFALPNMLTYARIAAVPVVVALMYYQGILDGPLWVRWAALAVFIAAGITDVLEAAYGGYLTVYSDTPNAKRLTDGLGREWETLHVGYKPHASVTSIHTALDGLTEIMRENNLKAGDIAKLETGLSPMTHVHCAWEYKAQGVTAAQMNLYYGLAVTAIDGMAFTEQYKESRLKDPAIFDFISRVSAFVDPEIEKMGAPYRHAARVRVTARDGKVIEKLLHHRRGSPENPLKPADVEYKFKHVAKSCLSAANIDKVMQLVAKLDKLDSTSELISILAAPTAR